MCDVHSKKGNCIDFIPSNKPKLQISLTVNGERMTKEVDPTMTLLQFLNKDLKLFGTKEGCGEGECGACTIIMNKEAVNSCLILAVEADQSELVTVEGLAQGDSISDLQREFITHDALQCGFCTPGMLMSSRALLDKNNNPTVEEIKEAIAGNFCRCTGYVQIVDAVLATAKKERGEA
jgi:carbon-monoxide dehydrogenase small subunit